MLETKRPSPGLVFFSFLYRSDLFVPAFFKDRMAKTYGPTIHYAPLFNPLAGYYAKEMGEETDLKRIFFLTTTPFPREFFLSSKLLALEWERDWAQNQKRMVNIDTGLLTLENFALATTKNYAHRLYIGQNIFSDLTYQSLEGKFQTLPWTYPDYRDQDKVDFFSWARTFLLTQGRI